MDRIKKDFRLSSEYIATFVKCLLTAVLIGGLGGVLGSVFHKGIDYVTELRAEQHFWIFLLPIGGVFITLMYKLLSSNQKIDTDRVIESVRKDTNIPIVMMPLIFFGTLITHLVGGSAGREGAALQLGGSLGYNVGKLFNLDKNRMHIIVMSGMSAVFAALFGTPVTAAVFSLEVTTVGVFHYAGFFPCVVSALTASKIALLFGLKPVGFGGINFGKGTPDVYLKVLILAVLCAVVSILFCTAHKQCNKLTEKFMPNVFLRSFVCGTAVLLMTLAVGSGTYNGAGMDVVTRAIGGNAAPEAFLLKIIFTSVTIAAGYKGGEIVPAFFIGSTFGCAIAPVLGLDPSIAAAIGFVAVFCGIVNCPIASLVLSVEVFGSEGVLLFALACTVSYMMSGMFGIYHSQKIVYSKLDDKYIDGHTV